MDNQEGKPDDLEWDKVPSEEIERITETVGSSDPAIV